MTPSETPLVRWQRMSVGVSTAPPGLAMAGQYLRQPIAPAPASTRQAEISSATTFMGRAGYKPAPAFACCVYQTDCQLKKG